MKDITPEDSVVPVYLVPPTKEEVAEQKQRVLEDQERKQQEKAKEEAKASALVKLAKLGLTEEEAKAIIGI